MEHVHFKPEVGLVGSLPGEVHAVVGDIDPAKANPCLAKGIAIGAGVDLIQVSEAIVRTTNVDVAITHFTVREADLQHLDGAFQGFEESFIGDYPAQAVRGEEPVTAGRGEILGAIVAEVIFREIPVVKRIGDAACETSCTIGYGTGEVAGKGVDVLALVIQDQGVDAVLTDGGVVVQSRLGVDPAIATVEAVVREVVSAIEGQEQVQGAVGIAAVGDVIVLALAVADAKLAEVIEGEHAREGETWYEHAQLLTYSDIGEELCLVVIGIAGFCRRIEGVAEAAVGVPPGGGIARIGEGQFHGRHVHHGLKDGLGRCIVRIRRIEAYVDTRVGAVAVIALQTQFQRGRRGYAEVEVAGEIEAGVSDAAVVGLCGVGPEEAVLVIVAQGDVVGGGL